MWIVLVQLVDYTFYMDLNSDVDKEKSWFWWAYVHTQLRPTSFYLMYFRSLVVPCYYLHVMLNCDLIWWIRLHESWRRSPTQFMLHSRIVWTAISLLSKKEKLLEKSTEMSLLHLLLSVRTIRKKFFCFPCVTFREKSWEYSVRSLRTREDEIGDVKLVFYFSFEGVK